MPEQSPAGEKIWDKYENGKAVNKINITVLHQVQVAGIYDFESWLSYLKNLIVSSFLVLSNQRLQKQKFAKVEYVWIITHKFVTRVREMIKNENEPLK